MKRRALLGLLGTFPALNFFRNGPSGLFESSFAGGIDPRFVKYLHTRINVLARDGLGNPIITDMDGVSAVYIDKARGEVFKTFWKDQINSSGTYARVSAPKAMKYFLETEIDTHQRLDRISSQFKPKLVGYSVKKGFLMEEYLGEDLHSKGVLNFEENRHYRDQVLQMLGEYKTIGVFKPNLATSNLFERNGNLIASDFKWCTKRLPNLLLAQMRAIKNLFGRNLSFDERLALKEAFNDLSLKDVEFAISNTWHA